MHIYGHWVIFVRHDSSMIQKVTSGVGVWSRLQGRIYHMHNLKCIPFFREEFNSLPPTKYSAIMLSVWQNGSPPFLYFGSFSLLGWGLMSLPRPEESDLALELYDMPCMNLLKLPSWMRHFISLFNWCKHLCDEPWPYVICITY